MNTSRIAGVCAAVAVAAMGLSQAASAGTVRYESINARGLLYGALSFAAAPGETNDVTATVTPLAATVTDTGNPLQPDPAAPSTPSQCTFNADKAVCRSEPGYPFSGPGVSLGDGDDVGRVNVSVPDEGVGIPGVFESGGLDGGPGNDVLYGSAGSDRLVGGPGADDLYGGLGTRDFVSYTRDGDPTIGVHVTIDGVADDGRPGEHDNVRNDVEMVFAPEEGDSVLIGNASDNALFGGDGDDVVRGGAGNDELWGGLGPGPGGTNVIDGGPGLDVLIGADGDDTIDARDGLRDQRISCWGGNDVVEADPIDEPDPDCETVHTG